MHWQRDASPKPIVALSKEFNYSDWIDLRRNADVAGHLGPYSVDLLEHHGFRVTWSDRAYRSPWSHRAVRKPFDFIEHRRADLKGLRVLASSYRELVGADVILSIFEDKGAAMSVFRPLVRNRARARPLHAMVVCWMAQRALLADERTLRQYRRALRSADLVFFFSANQTEIFRDRLGVPSHKLCCVPFGVDVEFFRAHGDQDAQRHLVAVGGDGSRDYDTLVSAAAGLDAEVRIFAPESQRPRVLPSNIVWTATRIDHHRYRDELKCAAAVVVPVKDYAYPGGQTVVLEAMAAGKAVLTADTVAMRDYVTDKVTGRLYSPGDALHLRELASDMLNAPSETERVGQEAQDVVAAKFSQSAMWSAIGRRIHDELFQ